MNRFWLLGAACLLGASQAGPPNPEEFARRIDVHANAASREFPAARVGDGEFLRRVMLDLVGHPPSLEQTRAFLADLNPDKRTAVVDELLESYRFAHHWARRFAEVLLGDTSAVRCDITPALPSNIRQRLASDFILWLARKIRDDCSWGEVVRDLASARGTTERRPELAWRLSFHLNGEPTLEFGSHAPRQLLGISMLCARCHDHPFDRWTVEDHAAMAAFVARQTVRVLPATKLGPIQVEVGEGDVGESRWDGVSRGKGPAIAPRLLTTRGEPLPGESRLEALGRLLSDPRHEQLSRMMGNRVWFWLMGRGIVHPVDDFNMRHKPLSPQLLEELRRCFDAGGRSIKFLVRAICRSEAYQRGCEGDEAPKRIDYSRGQIRPLTMEQLVSSLRVATLGAPGGELQTARAPALSVSPPVLTPACEVTPLSVTRWAALYVRNNDELWDWIREGPVLRGIREAPASFEWKVDEMFLAALSRKPTVPERERFVRFLGDGGAERFEDAYWALLNSHEFLTRH